MKTLSAAAVRTALFNTPPLRPTFEHLKALDANPAIIALCRDAWGGLVRDTCRHGADLQKTLVRLREDLIGEGHSAVFANSVMEALRDAHMAAGEDADKIVAMSIAVEEAIAEGR